MFKHTLCIALGLSLVLSFGLGAAQAADDKPLQIVIVAGTKSHGYGSHEFNAGGLLLERELKRALRKRVAITVHRDGWPSDAKAFDNADAVILYMNGGGRHPILQQLAPMRKLMAKGIGLMCMHYAVEVPKGEAGRAFQDWIGGYYESGFSINPHWKAKAKLHASHPITRGVERFDVHDEWYFNMRFREGHKGVTNILQAVPDDEARSGKTSYPRGPKKHIVEASGRTETLLWAVEREDGGRGVGFTGGHFHWNWAQPHYRRLILNAIVWVAGGDVPKAGVPVLTISLDDLKANQDYPPNPKRADFKKIEADVKRWNALLDQ